MAEQQQAVHVWMTGDEVALVDRLVVALEQQSRGALLRYLLRDKARQLGLPVPTMALRKLGRPPKRMQ